MSETAPLDTSGVSTATGTLSIQSGLIALSSGLVPAGQWFRADNDTVMQVAQMLRGHKATVTYRTEGRNKVAVGIEAA